MPTVTIKLLLAGLLLLLAGAAPAQTPLTDSALSSFYDQLNAYRTARYQSLPDLEALTLPSTFSGADLRALNLQSRHIVRVDLVYTAFRLNPAFNQRQLNLSRIRNLAAGVPGLLEDESITWTLVEQTGCNSPAECQPFFHGFVVYVARHATAATSRADLDSLTRKLRLLDKKLGKKKKAQGKKVACNLPMSRFTVRQMASHLHKLYKCPERTPQILRFQLTVDAHGNTRRVQLQPARSPLCTAELEEAIRQSVVFASGFPVNGRQFGFTVKGALRLPVRGWRPFADSDLAITSFALPDSAARLYRVFLKKRNKQHKNDYCEARITKAGELLAAADTAGEPDLPYDAGVVSRVMNRHPEWPKEVVVTDVTGSMFPYTYDLLAWLQLSALQDEEKTFVFFNDGNDAPDKDKRVGKTGGLYHVKADSYEPIKNKLIEAMKAGGGGDAPENDAEALLYARQLTSDSTDVILIADNYTFPRDTKLLKNTTAHVRIILCGVRDYINPRYLALARQHGFTLHTIEGDIEDLSKVLEGQIITIQGQQYEVTKEGFRLVRKT
jgi:hypothetical protein